MKLPNARDAVIEEAKVRGYLLNPAHRYGESKARFFLEFGFTRRKWEDFVVALKEHALDNDVVKVRETGFGPRYEIDGEIVTPDRRRPRVRTVWQFDRGEVAPRLITAHPLEREA